jgi:Protein of unknown function with HXXEE motif
LSHRRFDRTVSDDSGKYRRAEHGAEKVGSDNHLSHFLMEQPRIMIATELLNQQSFRFGFAWVLLSIALTLHVTDEALTDFLSVYNPAVQAIRKRIPFVPLPIFTFRVWLAGLCLGILVALGLSLLAFRGSRLALVLANPVAILMFGNGIGHMAASFYRRRLMPGVYSSPVLVAASAYLFVCAQAVRHVACDC